jgi:hypothetical protein
MYLFPANAQKIEKEKKIVELRKSLEQSEKEKKELVVVPQPTIPVFQVLIFVGY